MITIGKISKPYGILGWVYVISFTEIKKNIFKYFPWRLETLNIQLNKNDISMYRKYSRHYILKLKNINNRTQAIEISKKKIYIQRNQLPLLNNQEYYWHDLFHCYVYNDKREKIGPIINILDNSIYNTLQVLYKKKNKNIYIPFIKPAIIKTIDIKNKIIVINNSHYI